MKSLKGRGGVIGKGITENVLNVWTKTMHRCAEVSDALDECVLDQDSDYKHKDLLPGRIKRDNVDFDKMQSWFQEHNPFTCGDELVCLDSGLVDENNSVTCDKAEEIGALIQKTFDGKNFANCSIKRKDKLTNMQILYSSITIDKETVDIDPLTLFLRLVVAIGRKPETEIETQFKYELSPYRTSLFKCGMMRPASNKAKLNNYFLKEIVQSDAIEPLRNC